MSCEQRKCGSAYFSTLSDKFLCIKLVALLGLNNFFRTVLRFLAHLSQRLIGELIGYSWSGVRPLASSVGVVRRKQFQTSSSPKPLGQSKPNFMWSLLG